VESSVARRLVCAGGRGVIMAIHRVEFAAADLLAEAVVWAVTLLTSRGGFVCCTEMTRLAAE